MKRPAAIVMALVAALALLLTSCSGDSDPSSDGTVQLTFRQFDPPTEISGLEQAIATWNEQNPSIQVELETLSGADAMQQFAREANSGSGPDVIQMGYVNVKDLAKPKILLPLDDLIASDPMDVPLDDFLALDMNQFEGQTWGLPWTVDTFAMAYNPEVLATAGLEIPADTWEQFAMDAQAIATANDGTSGFCFAGASGPAAGQWFGLNYQLWSNDVSLIVDNGGTWQVGGSAADFAAGIDYFNSFFTSGATAKSFIAIESFNDPQIVQGLANGTCGMAMLPPQTFRQALETNPELKTTMMPAGAIEGTSHLGGRSLGINASTDHPEEAWQFIKFLNSAEAFTTIEQYPASTTVLGDMEVPTGEEGFQQQLPQSRSFARYINGPIPVPTLQKIANAAYGSVYSGQLTSEQAAEQLVQQIEAELG